MAYSTCRVVGSKSKPNAQRNTLILSIELPTEMLPLSARRYMSTNASKIQKPKTDWIGVVFFSGIVREAACLVLQADYDISYRLE